MARRWREVARQVAAEATMDGAGVRLNRTIGSSDLPDLDPFLLLDEFKTDDSRDYIAGFPDHPHRGFETVTYMISGRMRHADNGGNRGSLEAGSVQWMTAGRGIVHSEMPEQEQGRMQGFQLWVNLPAANKMCEPRYQNIAPGDVPEVTPAAGVRARVIAGAIGGVRGAVDGIAVDPLCLDVELAPGAVLEPAVPAGHAAFVFVFAGAMKVGGAPPSAGIPVPEGTLAVLGDGDTVNLAGAGAGGRALLVAGAPLGEPITRYGPFVMNTEQEIRQAVRDYQSGAF